MSNGASRKPHFCDCGWNGHRDCALWITSRPRGGQAHLCPWPRAERCGRIQYVRRASLALCGKTSIGRTKQSVSGHVRKDEAALGTKAAHLWPCAERREQRTPGVGRGARGHGQRGMARTEGQGPVRSRPRRSRDTGAGQLARGRTGSSQEVRTGSASRSWAATRGSYDVQARQRLAYSPRAATSSSWLPNSAIRPSMTTAIRSASCAVCRRWAMATTVRPSSRAAIDPSR
jgi:hypothetical protein